MEDINFNIKRAIFQYLNDYLLFFTDCFINFYFFYSYKKINHESFVNLIIYNFVFNIPHFL